MRVLHIAPSFYPAAYWGGPIWSTKAICDGIAARGGFDLRVLTTDAAGPQVGQRITPEPLGYPVRYARRIAGQSVAPALLAALPRAIGKADVVHLTGAYSAPTLPVFAICRMLDRPLVWSPRGALLATRDWQDAPKRRMKRAFVAALARIAPRGLTLHVTSDVEGRASMEAVPQARLAVIPNAVDLPQHYRRPLPAKGGLRLLSLGRLHPKKGLERLIAAMGRLPAEVVLDIYGTGAPDYTARLQGLAAPFGGRIRFHGAVSGDAKTRAFAGADIFVLPSHSENFGIVVAEALAHAVPVITTQATPWRGIAAKGCGGIVSDSDDLAEVIAQLAAGDLDAMGQRGRAWMARDFGTEAMVAAFAGLYQAAAHRQSEAVTA